MDFAEARRRMVDGQLRPNRVTDPRLLDAMRSLPREMFLPAALRGRAYVDEDVTLPGAGGGRTLMEPMVLARLVQLAAPRPGDRALVLGAGAGYGTAVLAHVGTRVTAVEQDAGLAEIARAALAAVTLPPGSWQLEVADPAAGYPSAAPYDLILIEGQVPELPAEIVAQLAEGGRLVAAEGSEGGRGPRAVLARRIGGAVTVTPAFDCAVAPLPAFARAPSFVF